MKFKRFRYNLITLGLVAIVGCCVAFPLITGADGGPNQGGIVEEPPALSDEWFSDENTGGDDVVDDKEEEQKPNTPAINFQQMDAFKLVSYSLEDLYSGAGFVDNFSQVLSNEALILGASVTVKQNNDGKISRSGKNSLQENYFHSNYSGPGDGELKRFYQYQYVDRDLNTFKQGRTSSYNPTARTYNMNVGQIKESTIEEGYSEFVFLAGDEFPYPAPSEKLADRKIKDNVQTVGTSGYRELTFKYNEKKVPQSIVKFYGSTGQLTNIKLSSLEITFRINIKTGKMLQIIISESMNGKNPSFNANVISNVTTTHNFKNVGKAADINLPM